MTIERQWIEIMKQEVPSAFSPGIPFTPEVGFIDAQIKLMGMPRENSWDGFMSKQFVWPVRQMFRDGAGKVILAFDDYANVPRAKSITQAKRIARLTPLAFGADEQLPPFPPIPWAAAMGSRVFKVSLIPRCRAASNIFEYFTFCILVIYLKRDNHRLIFGLLRVSV